MNDREAFEAWCREAHLMGGDDFAWNEHRRCYNDVRVHLMWQAYRAALARAPVQQSEPVLDDLIDRLRQLEAELDANDSPEQIHPGALTCAQAADIIKQFRLQRDLDGPAWEKHVERMQVAEAACEEGMRLLREAQLLIAKAAGLKLVDGTYFDKDCACTMMHAKIDAYLAKVKK